VPRDPPVPVGRPWARGALRPETRGLLRETTFVLGGAMVIAMGVALIVGLLWSGAGWEYAGGWLGAFLAIGFGAFFVQVGRGEGAERRRWLREHEAPETGAPPAR